MSSSHRLFTCCILFQQFLKLWVISFYADNRLIVMYGDFKPGFLQLVKQFRQHKFGGSHSQGSRDFIEYLR